MEKFRIGDVVLENHIIVGPMAGISNQGFRSILKQFGAALLYSEMISDKAIVYKNKQTLKMTEVLDTEKPLALQLFGSELESMVQAAQYMDTMTACDIIDINMGCPVNKVVKNNGGSSLMRHPEETFEMVKAIVDKVKKPVTAKIRAGWDEHSINAVEMAIGLQQAGVAAIAVHPRTRTQFYSGKAEWSIIRDVKNKVSIPVIGNGDIKKVEDMLLMKEETNCDAFMVARGCLGNPWLIRQLVHYEQYHEILPEPNNDEKLDQCLQHAQRLVQLKGETIGIKEMRGHACWYINGMYNNNQIKSQINDVTTYNQLENVLEQYRVILHNL